MNKAGRFFDRLIMPPKCVSCGVLLEFDPSLPGIAPFCAECRSEWERAKLRRCSKCLKPMIDCLCAPSEFGKKGEIALIKLAAYGTARDRVLRRVLAQIKNKAPGYLCEFICEQLAFPVENLIKNEGIDREKIIVTYAPRPRLKRRTVGFDQSEIISKLLAKRLGVEFACLFSRRSDVSEQKKLNKDERRRNVREAFSIKEISLKGKTVVLFDDVVTTGVSMGACLRLIKSKGADRIACVSIARTERKRLRAKKLRKLH